MIATLHGRFSFSIKHHYMIKNDKYLDFNILFHVICLKIQSLKKRTNELEIFLIEQYQKYD